MQGSYIGRCYDKHLKEQLKMDKQNQGPPSETEPKGEPRQATSEIRKALDDHARKIEKHLGEIRREVAGMVPPVQETIAKHPIGSVAVALGVGVVLGALITGGQRKRNPGESNELLDAALTPVVQSVKRSLHGEESIEKQEVRDGYEVPSESALRNKGGNPYLRQSPDRGRGALSELVSLLLPIGVEAGLKALQKNARSDED